MTRRNQTWTPEEEQFLLGHAGLMTRADIANHLGRSIDSVREKLKTLRRAGRTPTPVIGAGWESFRELTARTERGKAWLHRRVEMKLIRTRWVTKNGQRRILYRTEDVDREHAKPNLPFVGVGRVRNPRQLPRVPEHLRHEFMAFVRFAEDQVDARLRREYWERRREAERRAG